MLDFIPTPDELIVLQSAQRNNQKRLDVLTTWSAADAEDAILNKHVWLEDCQEWAVSVADVAKLAFDSRMPDVWSTGLQRMAQWGSDNNKQYINPKNKPEYL